MREMTKDRLIAAVSGALVENGETDQKVKKIVTDVLVALESVIRAKIEEKFFDKIRINDILHIRVKYAAGGKYKDFQSGEIMTRPARYVAQLCTTFPLSEALKQRMATHLHDLTVPPEHLAPAPTASEE